MSDKKCKRRGHLWVPPPGHSSRHITFRVCERCGKIGWLIQSDH